MKPLSKIQRQIQITLVAGSLAIVGLYFALFYGELLGPGELLGTSPINLIIAGLHVVYFLLIRGFVNQKSVTAATAIDLGLFSVNLGILLLASGGFESPYFMFWLLTVLFASVTGLYTVGVYVALTALYLAVTAFLSDMPLEYLLDHIVYFAAVIAAGALGIWLWRNHPRKKDDEGASSGLGEKLEIEQLKSAILLRSIGDGVIVIDSSGVIRLLNQPAAEITGWSETEATGIDYRQVIPLEDEEGNELSQADDPFQSAMAQKDSFRRKDIATMNREQNKISLSLTVAPIFGNNRTVTGAVAIFSDISQEKINARQRDEFISTASHEMRTPVAAIEGFLALAMNPKVSSVDETARKYIEKAYGSTQHLGKLFKDLLSVTKLEDGRISNNPEPIELGKIIKNAIDELQFKAEQKHLDLRLKSNSGLAKDQSGVMPLFYVNVDPERIREVFTNLVDNAIKFTPEGEVNITIDGDDKHVTVGIHDQGIGIPKDEAKHLFQKFYRVDNSKTREIGGTGLGLYLCRTIIEMYNGRIWVESEENKGSSFYFTLPRLTYSQAQELRDKLERQETQRQNANQKGGQTDPQPGEEVAPITTST